MAIIFNPNPHDCSVSITGGGSGDVTEGSTITVNVTRKNYSYDTTPMPHYEPKFGGGWDPSSYTGTWHVNSGYKQICGYIGQEMPIDASSVGTINVTLYAKKDDDTIDINANINAFSDGTQINTSTNSEHVETTTTTTNQGFGIGQSPGFAPTAPKLEGSITANFPIFDTAQHARAFLETGDTTGVLTDVVVVVDNDYDYYIYNQITSTIGAGLNYQFYYRYKMQVNSRLAMYLITEDDSPYDRALIGTSGIIHTYKGTRYAQDPMPDGSADQTRFLGVQKRLTTGTTWTPVMYETNIPTFDTQAHAENYISTGDETGIIDKWRTDDVEPGEIGEPTDTTPQGENGMVLSYGGKMYRMTNKQLASFYDEVFDPTPNVVNAILEGLQLFGSNQINAIQGVTYFPFPISHVASLSNGNDIYIGTYKITQTTGDAVLKNDKLINMGTVYFAPPYGARDFRNYEPGCKLYIMLPYAGTHELQISKYIGKNVTLKMAVDLANGSGTYFLYAGNTIMDSFDCIVGVHRPITAVDHAQHVAASMNAILQTGTGAIKAIEAGASKDLKNTAKGALNAVTSGYQTLQTVNDAPMSTRGSFTGGTGLFDVKSPYFIFAQMKPQTPANLTAVMGRPSSTGGLVSSFSGYLSTCAFTLADGFTGTQEEAEEIYHLMAGGVYID